MANTYRFVQPLSQTSLPQKPYEGEDHNRNLNEANDDIVQNVPKCFPICDKCKLQRSQRVPEPTATVVKPSQSYLRESDTEWLSQADNVSSMKLLSMLMLNAWRQRRNEVKELQKVMENIKDENMKYKNQMHVYSTLVRVEQKRNDELTLQLKLSLESINQVRYSCDNLTASVLNLTVDKEELRQELEDRKQEYEVQKALLTQTKSDLLRSFRAQRDLQTRLSKEQRAFKEADENHKHILERMKSLLSVDEKIRRSEHDYCQELNKREKTIEGLCSDILILKEEVKKHEEEKNRTETSSLRNQKSMSQTMVNMNEEIASLKVQLEEQTKVMYSFVTVNANNRTLSGSWESMLQDFALNFFDMVLCLLPALPSPTNDVSNFYNFYNETNPTDNTRKIIQ